MAYDSAAVSNTVIAHKKGINLQTIRQLRDNMLAMFLGSAGAPRLQGVALDVHTGLLAVSGTSGVGFTDMDRVTNIRADFAASAPAGSAGNIRVRFSDDNGLTWGSWQDLVLLSSDFSISGAFRVDMETGGYFYAGAAVTAGVPSIVSASGTLTPTTDANAIQFSGSNANIDATLDVYTLGGHP